MIEFECKNFIDEMYILEQEIGQKEEEIIVRKKPYTFLLALAWNTKIIIS